MGTPMDDDFLNLNIGDLANMTACSVVRGTKADNIRLSYKAKRGRRMVFLFLGDEPDDGSRPIDGEAILNTMGWVRKVGA
jgi:hypothetical protein